MANKKLQVWLPLMFGVIMAVGMLLGYQLQNNINGQSRVGKNGINNTTDEVLQLINQKYVDNLNADTLNLAAVQAILNKLDPHSAYIPAAKLVDVDNELRGNFKGIGIEFQMINDTLNVVYVVENGPSAAAGLQVGDQILKAADTNIAGTKQSNENIKQLLRGQGGSDITVGILRNNQSQSIQIKRGIIPLPSVDAAYMASPGVGYIRLNKFAETTYIEFMQSMDKLKAQGMTQLLLDLRGNGGGILQTAVNIADEFLPDDKMIVYLEGNKTKRKDFKSTKPGVFEKGELVLLMDELSASASEVLAGALQDNDRCTIVGRRSFGKSLVQEQYGLSNGAALRLTIARYYSPLGRSIQKPYSSGRKNYNEEILNRQHHTDSLNNDSTFAEGKPYKTPKGKIVYDGGGITPDVYVANETNDLVDVKGNFYTNNTFNHFTYQYFKQNQTALKAFTTPKIFATSFHFSGSTWPQFMQFSKADSIEIPPNNEVLKTELLLQLKALLARQLFRNNGYFEVRNTTDKTFIKALEILAKG